VPGAAAGDDEAREKERVEQGVYFFFAWVGAARIAAASSFLGSLL
jgi:hypothetical protein